MSEAVCMDVMPENVQRSSNRMLRMSSQISIRGSSLALTELHPNIDATIMIANMADPPFSFDELGSFPFYMKFIQLLIAVVCSGLYSNSVIIVINSTADQLLPYIVFTVFMIINTVTILSYVLGQKVPDLSMRIFAILGCIMFAAASVVSFRVWRKFDYSLVDSVDEKQRSKMRRAPKLLLAQAFASFCNSILFFIDACYSYYKTTP